MDELEKNNFLDEIIKQVDELGDDITNNYQFIRTTYSALIKENNISPSFVDVFFEKATEKIEQHDIPFLLKAYNGIKNIGKYEFKLMSFIYEYCNTLMSDGNIHNEKDPLYLSENITTDQIQKFIETFDEVVSSKMKEQITSKKELEKYSFTTMYLWFVCLHKYISGNTSKSLLIFEKELIKYYTKMTEEKSLLQTANYIPKILESDDFKKKIETCLYLFYDADDKINGLENENKKIIDANEFLASENERLRNENTSFKKQSVETDNLIVELKNKDEFQAKEIARLDDLVEFNKKNYINSLDELKKVISQNIANSIEIELDELNTIAEHVDDDNKNRIERKIKNIHKILEEGGR